MTSRGAFPVTAAFVAVAAVLLVLVGGGIWWWSQSQTVELATQRDLDGAVRQCVEEVASRDPLAEARRDAANGEDSPLFVTHHGIVLTVSADGIERCGLDFSVPDWRYPDFDRGSRTDEEEPVCCDRDPVPNACGQAQDAWIRAYNAELVRLKPELVEKYCVDPDTGRKPSGG